MNKDTKEHDEEEYDEEADEDYQLDGSGHEDSGNEDSGEDDDVEGKEETKRIEKANYNSIESSEGGLIKTRNQRAQELVEDQRLKKVEQQKSTVDIDSFWAEMNSAKKPESKLEVTTQQVDQSHDKIKIKSTYEFAGKVISEDKWVDANGAEAKAYLNSVKLKDQGPEPAPEPVKLPLKRGVRRKRPSLLDQVINDEKTLKLSTLEKSRLDWSSYVDKEGIQDDLRNTNKGGYLQKQDFLNRVQLKLDDNYKAAQRK